MEGLGALGFWLGLGIFLAGGAIAGAMKELGKEREKQATLRALLTEKATPELLEYLREKDAAELKFMRQASGLEWGGGTAGGWLAIIVAALGIGAGLLSLAYTSPRREFVNTLERGPSGAVPRTELVTTAPLGDFALAPVAVMVAIWAAGLLIAWLIWRFFGKKKNDAQPGA